MTFLLYGANGYVGREIARMAVQSGLRPILAGRDAVAIGALSKELGLDHRAFSLDDAERGLENVTVVLNCAGPFIHTYKPIVTACLRKGAHYLDITGEIPVYQAIAALDGEAKARGVMLLPGVGFDVVPTDCLAVHLKRRLPTATRLTLAFQAEGPSRLPPGTQRTMIEMAPYGDCVRRDGRLVKPERAVETRMIDFGRGPVLATRITWGDVFMAYVSTGIPNIEDYLPLPESARKRMAFMNMVRPLLRLAPIRNLLKRGVKPGSTPEAREKTRTHVWGEVEDAQGRKATARLHGPEAGVVWTGRATLAVVKKVLGRNFTAGFQTPGKAYGPDLVLECEGVTREDVN